MFSPVLKFTLFERFSREQLEVSESMEVNGRRTFGFDEPIIYCLASRRELSKELLDSPDTVFVSKKEALEQCSLFLKVKKTKEASSTSEAAKALSEANADSSITYVAICNGEAAKAYGLKTYMVGEEVFNPSDAQADNKTTFNLYKAPKPKKEE